MNAGDVIGHAKRGLLARKMRTVLSCCGIAIAVGAMTAVLGMSASAEDDVLSQIDQLQDVLTVQSVAVGANSSPDLPQTAYAMAARIPTVAAVAGTRSIRPGAYRTDIVPAYESQGLTVRAYWGNLAETADVSLVGSAPPSDSRLPEAVLGRLAGDRLGIAQSDLPTRIWIGDRWVVVTGILMDAPLAPDLDSSVLVPASFVRESMGVTGSADTLYVKVTQGSAGGVRGLLPATVDPEDAGSISVNRPSDAIRAEAAASGSFARLLLAMSVLGLLVAGFGVTNTLLIAVAERRTEIGIQRSLGATRAAIGSQFVAEGILVAAVGGLLGVGAGLATTVALAAVQGIPAHYPASIIGIVVLITPAVGSLASLYPAMRAARLSPNECLRTS